MSIRKILCNIPNGLSSTCWRWLKLIISISISACAYYIGTLGRVIRSMMNINDLRTNFDPRLSSLSAIPWFICVWYAKRFYERESLFVSTRRTGCNLMFENRRIAEEQYWKLERLIECSIYHACDICHSVFWLFLILNFIYHKRFLSVFHILFNYYTYISQY